jgi:hypothetical protein
MTEITPERVAEIRDNDAFAHKFRGAGWPDDATIAEIDRTDVLAAFDAVQAERDALKAKLEESEADRDEALSVASFASEKAQEVRRERDALKAAIEGVRALRDRYAAVTCVGLIRENAVMDLDDALAVPESTEEATDATPQS